MEKKPLEPTIMEYTLEFNTLIVNFVREYIKKTKEFYKLTDEEIANIIGVDGISYSQLMDENFNGDISSGIIATMYIITGGKLSLSKIAENFEFDEDIFNKEVHKILKKHYEKKIDKLLNYLQIDSEDKLDEFLKNFEEIVNVVKNKQDILTWLRSE